MRRHGKKTDLSSEPTSWASKSSDCNCIALEQITVWVGDVPWTACKPLEGVVLRGYNGSAVSNQTVPQFGQPLTALFGEGEVAIIIVKPRSGTPVNSGSTSFAGNARFSNSKG
jgi:hypothetical protein